MNKVIDNLLHPIKSIPLEVVYGAIKIIKAVCTLNGQYCQNCCLRDEYNHCSIITNPYPAE